MILAAFVALIVIFVILPLVAVTIWWVISTAIVGVIVGALGRLVVPGHNPIGFLATIVCGLAGALIGAAIAGAIGGGWLVRVLLQIGVAAAGVAGWEATHRRSITGSARPARRTW
ncbi:MAG TPA: GlsB/YeaQ/YmgE family stress response membrane protein [Mycobacteriales bacterium]|nr:GlsB/YeaQ/YmgE family stress response membrane protein [Mycobacteriales bacterium]